MKRIVDLSLLLEPGVRGVEFERKFTHARDGWNGSTLHLYSHCGTHLDAPVHFEVSRQTIEQIPLERCLGPAWVADLTFIQPRQQIEADHLGKLADRIRSGDGLLLKTGWSRFAGEPKYRDELPRVSPDFARWCVERKIRTLGVEPPSVADVNDLPEVTLVHQILLGGGILIVEGLANLEALQSEKVLFVAIPLKLSGGDGSPVRAFAIDDPGMVGF